MLMTSRELALRWRMTEHTINKMRWQGDGPPYIKLGHRTVRYSIQDVIEFEQRRAVQAA